MKISVFSVSGIALGKYNIKDTRFDQVYNSVKAAKKTYVQVELVGEESALNAEAILIPKDSACDLILRDLEFIETRLSRAENEQEKIILDKLKSVLEKEELIFNAGLNEEEKRLISGLGLLTDKPTTLATKEEWEDLNSLLARAVKESNFISFFTAVGGKETRAWLIRQGTTAWEAAGIIHSDIQQGFIRAEVISFNDFLQTGGLTQAKQAEKMRLEQKDYVIQDADIISFRFNK